MKKILVTTDGSKNSEKALLEAKKYAGTFHAKLDILSVVDNSFLYAYMEEKYYSLGRTEEELDKFGEELLEESLKLFDDFEGELNVKLRRGDPADAIIKEAEKEDYDLVVMGSRGLGTFSRAILGSVSNKVLNHVETNILIVK
ncbi:MAG: universal stress protein [Tissierella sp.]|uniref:universal stress protein n=1 Tax=Tissierella sp. TaxID=41274 RepID=UPI003F9B31E5